MERLDLRDLPAFPPWLVELARKRKAVTSDGESFDTARALQGFPEGQRDSGLFALAGKFRQANLPYDVAEPLMREAAANCAPPFPADEAMAKLRGAYERYPAGPSKGKGTHARGPVTRQPLSPPATGIVMDTVEPKPLRWVWQGYIPRGKITVLDGDPGLGKSLVTIDLIARVTTGRPFPDGSPGSRGGCVLLTAEDDLGDTVRPRLEAAGADLSKVVALTAVGEGDTKRPLSLPRDIASLIAAIDQVDAVLVVIDPLMAYLNAEVNSHRDQDVRGALVHVKELAESKNCAILLVRHLNKSGGGNPLYRGGGSIGIIAAARSGLLIAEDPDDQKARVFAPTKANLSRLSPALSYIVSVTESGVPHIRWTGSSPHTAASLVTSSMEAGDRSAITGAKDFLYDVLGAGAQPAMEVEKDATEAGISKATLRRARSALKIKASKRGKPGTDGQHWVWELPEGDQRAESDGLALEDAHADERLREPEDAQPVRFERLREEPPSESSSYQIGNAPERASHEDAHADERLREEQPPAPEGAQVQEGQGSSGIGAREEYTV